MSEVKMLTAPVPNVPWQERPQGPQNGAPIWRYSENPIIGRNPLKGVARIFNSAVMPYGFSNPCQNGRQNQLLTTPEYHQKLAKTYYPLSTSLLRRSFQAL